MYFHQKTIFIEKNYYTWHDFALEPSVTCKHFRTFEKLQARSMVDIITTSKLQNWTVHNVVYNDRVLLSRFLSNISWLTVCKSNLLCCQHLSWQIQNHSTNKLANIQNAVYTLNSPVLFFNKLEKLFPFNVKE